MEEEVYCNWWSIKEDLKCVRKLVEDGVNILMEVPYGKTLLGGIISLQDVDLITDCLHHYTILNAPLDGARNTALHLSVDEGLQDIASKLIELGADLEGRNSSDRTPLHIAASTGNLAMIELLVKHGADIEARDRWSSTPLHLACIAKNDSYRCVRRICRDGADVNVRDIEGRTPLSLAVSNESNVADMKYVCHLLMEAGSDPNLTDDYGMSPLHKLVLCEGKDEDIKATVEVLLDKGAFIDIRNNAGNSPLCLAFKIRKWSVVNFLIENGAELDFVDMEEPELLLIRHLALRSCSNSSICPRIKGKIFQNEYLKSYLYKCQEEVELLKTNSIDGTTITLLDTLNCSLNKLSKYVRNEEVVSEIEKYSEIVSMYGNYLKVRLKEGLRRLEEERTMMVILYDICGPLVLPVMERILKYLSLNDHKTLIDAYKLDFFS